MKLRLANIDDLPVLKIMYKKIIDNMKKNDIDIWDDIYPIDFLENDIKNRDLYVLVKDNCIIAALALCENHSGERFVKWTCQDKKVMYINRLGVNVEYLRMGIGSLILNMVVEIARSHNIKYLRLFVNDMNQPAIQLYLKNGFKQVQGVYNEVIDDELILHELGFERKI